MFEDYILLDPSIVAKPLPICPAAKLEHPFIKLLKRIRDFVIDIFNSFIELFKSSPNLQIDQLETKITELKKARGLNLKNKSLSLVAPPSKLSASPLRASRSKLFEGLDLAGSRLPKWPHIQVEENNKLFDSSIFYKPLTLPQRNIDIPPSIVESGMEHLYFQGQRVVHMATDVVYQEMATPIVKSFQKGLIQAPAIIKTVSEIGKVIDFQAFQALYEKFAGLEIQQKVNSEFKQLLAWLTKRMPQDFQTTLKNQILEKDKKANPDELDKYLHPLCTWIKSKHVHPLMLSYDGVDGIDGTKVNMLLQHAVRILLEHKLDKFIRLVNDRLGKQLPIIVQGMMQKNAQIISSGILERIISILDATMSNEKTPFPKMIDSLIGEVRNHTNALIAVDAEKQKAIKNARAKIAKNKLGGDQENEESRETLMGKQVYIEGAARDAAEAASKEALIAAKDIIKLNKQIASDVGGLYDPSTKASAETFLKKLARMGEQDYLKAEIQKAAKSARQKAEQKAKAEYDKHKNIKKGKLTSKNEAAKKEAKAKAFFEALTLQGEEAYAASKAKKVEAGPYVYHSDEKLGPVCDDVIADLLKNSEKDGRTKLYNDFAEQIVEAILPRQKVIALEDRYKATLALNIDGLKTIFHKILDNGLNKIPLPEQKADENKLKEELFKLCTGISDENFEEFIQPLIENLNAKILRAARHNFSQKLSVDEVASVMKATLYPQVENPHPDPDIAQSQVEALLKEQQSGEVQVEVDQLAMIRSSLSLHEEIRNLIEEAKIYAAEIISEDGKGDITEWLQNGFDSFVPMIEENALDSIKTEIQNQVSSMIQVKVEQFSDPETLNELAGTVFLPTITQQMLKFFGRNLILKNLSTFVPYFKELAQTKKNGNKAYKVKRTEIFNKIADKLSEDTKHLLVKSIGDFEKLPIEEYREMIRPTLALIEKSLYDRQEASSQMIGKTITKALNPAALNKSNLDLGALANDMLTKLGNLKINFHGFDLENIKFFKNFLIGLINDMANFALQDIRKSPHALVDIFVSILEKKFPEENGINGKAEKLLKANKEKLREMMFGTLSLPKTKKEADQTKTAEIKKISRIAYDLIIYQMEENWSLPLKRIAIEETKKMIDPPILEKTITDIFQKTLGCNRLMNENLAIKCLRTMLKAITEASDRLQENAVPTIVATVPTLIPALV